MERQTLGDRLSLLLAQREGLSEPPAATSRYPAVSPEERVAVQRSFFSLRSVVRRVLKLGFLPVDMPLDTDKSIDVSATLARVSAPSYVDEALKDEWHPFYGEWLSLLEWARSEGLAVRIHSKWARGEPRRYYVSAKPLAWPDWDL